MERNLQEREMGLDTYESLLDAIANIPEINQETEKNTAEFISLVARHYNYAGLDSKTATEFICGKYELDITVVSQTVLYIYAVYADEFGSKSLMYNLKVRNKFDDEDWQKTPYIPQMVYDNLPTILQFATDKFQSRKRDIFLT